MLGLRDQAEHPFLQKTKCFGAENLGIHLLRGRPGTHSATNHPEWRVIWLHGGFLITKVGSIPTAVSALRPSRGVGKGLWPPPTWGQVSRKPGLEFNCASETDGVAVTRAPGTGSRHPETRECEL